MSTHNICFYRGKKNTYLIPVLSGSMTQHVFLHGEILHYFFYFYTSLSDAIIIA